MIEKIIISIIPVISSLLAVIIQSIINNRKERNNRKYQMLCKIYDDRINAYKELYIEIIKIEKEVNDIIFNIDTIINENLISLMPIADKFNEFSIDRYIYFDKETIKLIEIIISNIYRFVMKNYKKDSNKIRLLEEQFNLNIKNINKHIKKAIGIEKINKEMKY